MLVRNGPSQPGTNLLVAAHGDDCDLGGFTALVTVTEVL